ncbi:isochorismatase family protein [Streptomyces sp. NPDC021019]|uniref:isochorismatase family protein n=1 Tax=Streptomyces sp. NPDC021019 TaxID=3365108 RepID=UPI0037956371
MMLNVTAVARAVAAYDLPVVLSTVGVELGMNTGTIQALRAELPDAQEIDRTTLNSWENPEFRAAVEATGRRKLIVTGLWTEVCVAFPTLDMLREGYDVYPVTNAIGGFSRDAHERAVQRMTQAGAQPVTAISLTCELQRDWGRPGADSLRRILRWYFPELQKLTS